MPVSSPRIDLLRFIPFSGTNIPKTLNMAKVHVCNVLVLDNPAQFMTKLEFEITFECIEDLPEDLEWKIIYVGSAESEEFDQILDTVYVSNISNT